MKAKQVMQNLRELRALLADISEVRFESPGQSNSITTRIMNRAILWMIYVISELATINYQKKVPRWPFRVQGVEAIGYGREKIVYKLSIKGEGKADKVVAVYHLESMGTDAREVIQKKQRNYETYKNYFDSLIVPTSFELLDNPWGKVLSRRVCSPL